MSNELREALNKRAQVLKEIRKKRKAMKKAVELRNDLPEFIRYHWWRYFRLERGYKWRKPKGNDNKSRLQLKGYPPIVKVGYRTPKEVRGLHPSGLEPVIVHNVKELEKVDKEKHIVYIASSVGKKKRAEIIRRAQELGVRVANGGVEA
ncbi:50S ribosomal protein L32e [Ignicoccus hospitalis]|uniref:Large ribosomal subunit protein eL32 n=1 Tax=Ignicoccus hospitalis (strain KIN4/I / DSM 18386 / JCM 14125) TaxID=453591 RepID=A8AC03_IGNH4|nr:50S ribosomal protein L32e [Ignicoccus hospitalis]ABU82455.1 LSU ribosomal protein L32E [Ignicoccus hospitalis KIN4/I]HIH90550.1 50S ribosomal protein L32e [Desulfurococcaceae archaeon]